MSETISVDEVEMSAPSTSTALPIKEVKQLLTQRFPAARGNMHIRALWSRNGVHYYRVNWWRELPGDASYIGDSAFVAVEETGQGLSVRETTRRSAA